MLQTSVPPASVGTASNDDALVLADCQNRLQTPDPIKTRTGPRYNEHWFFVLERLAFREALRRLAPQNVQPGGCRAGGTTPLSSCSVVELMQDVAVVDEQGPGRCVTCKKEVGIDLRCKACHALRSRMNRLLKPRRSGGGLDCGATAGEAGVLQFYKKYSERGREQLLSRMRESHCHEVLRVAAMA